MNYVCRVIAILGTAMSLGGLVPTAHAQPSQIFIAQISAEVFFNRGVDQAERGDFQKAIQDYNQALRLNPNYADARINRGNAYSALGDKKAAIEDLHKAANLSLQQG